MRKVCILAAIVAIVSYGTSAVTIKPEDLETAAKALEEKDDETLAKTLEPEDVPTVARALERKGVSNLTKEDEPEDAEGARETTRSLKDRAPPVAMARAVEPPPLAAFRVADPEEDESGVEKYRDMSPTEKAQWKFMEYHFDEMDLFDDDEQGKVREECFLKKRKNWFMAERVCQLPLILGFVKTER